MVRSTEQFFHFSFSCPTTPVLCLWLGLDSAGIGFKLLEKMGWKAGTGLGVQGQEGPVEPIRTIQKDDHLGKWLIL